MKKLLFYVVLFSTIMAQAQQKEIPLYTGIAPGSENWNWTEKTSAKNSARIKTVYNVVNPSLTIFVPDPAISNGTSLIVCPGGGMHFLAIDHEGNDVAKWLVKKGITVFVLKYRLVHVLNDNPFEEMLNVKDKKAWDAESEPIIPLSIADGREAIAYVRNHATEYKILPDRIGIMGFSAGGTVAASAAFNYNKSNRPDFVAAIYAYIPESLQTAVLSDAPPLFVACASDDELGLTAHTISLYNKWYAAKRSAEMHLFAKGGHGFGMAKQNIPTDKWIDLFGDWLDGQGLLKKK